MKYSAAGPVPLFVDNALALPFPVASLPDTASPSCPADEAEWARAACGGDKAAFARLVEKHKAAVYGLCYRLLGSSDEARDSAQEAFVRAFTSLARFDEGQPFGAWILRIARNHCIDLLRRRKPTVALEPGKGDEQGPATELPDRFAKDGEQAMQEREAQRDLDAAVARLSPRYREVISLFHVQHRSYAEIAQILGVPMGTVMTWLHPRPQGAEGLARGAPLMSALPPRTCLTDGEIQALADGTLRGPQRRLAEEHCEACALCAGEREIYAALSGQLSALQDPPLPVDFTAQVLAAVGEREQHLVARRQLWWAAAPALLVAVTSVIGWIFLAAPAHSLDELIAGLALWQRLSRVVGPVFAAARLQLAGFALVYAAVLGLLLTRLLGLRSRAPSPLEQ